MQEEFDSIEGLESHEEQKIPLGWWAIFWGLIIFGIVYAYLYTPAFSGWSQEAVYQESLRE